MIVQVRKNPAGQMALYHNGIALILPSGLCQYCNGQDSALRGYQGCPVCGSPPQDQRQEVEDLQGELEIAQGDIDKLQKELDELKANSASQNV